MRIQSMIICLVIMAVAMPSWSALFGDGKSAKQDKKLIERITYLSNKLKKLQKERDDLEAARWQRKAHS